MDKPEDEDWVYDTALALDCWDMTLARTCKPMKDNATGNSYPNSILPNYYSGYRYGNGTS